MSWVEMADPAGYLLTELGVPGITRDNVALTYAFCLVSSEAIDWPVINQAIIGRWSPAGLEYIKRKAWKLYAAKVSQ